MSRRVVISQKEIYRRRGTEWAWHYKNYVFVRGLGTSLDREKIASVIQREVPNPIMRIDGSLVEGIETLRGVARTMEQCYFSWAYQDLICAWYWSEAGWDNFVQLFQSLPEVEQDYYLSYDAELDAILIVPMSQREPNANKGTKKVQLGGTRPVVPLISPISVISEAVD